MAAIGDLHVPVTVELDVRQKPRDPYWYLALSLLFGLTAQAHTGGTGLSPILAVVFSIAAVVFALRWGIASWRGQS